MPPTVHRLAASVVVRLVGLALILLAVLLLVVTVVVTVAGVSPDVLLVAAAVLLVLVLGAAWWLRSCAWVLRWTEQGYRVRLVRGAGVTAAAWREVDDAVTTTRDGVPCLELRLSDGRTTTIPVGLLAIDREQLVRDVQRELSRAHGLRPM